MDHSVRQQSEIHVENDNNAMDGEFIALKLK